MLPTVSCVCTLGTGQRVDGPSNGVAPLPWDVHCNPTQMFHSEVRFVEVPHTATVNVRTATALKPLETLHACLLSLTCERAFNLCVYNVSLKNRGVHKHTT